MITNEHLQENMLYGHKPASRDQAIERPDSNLKILDRAVATGYNAVKLLNNELRVDDLGGPPGRRMILKLLAN